MTSSKTPHDERVHGATAACAWTTSPIDHVDEPDKRRNQPLSAIAREVTVAYGRLGSSDVMVHRHDAFGGPVPSIGRRASRRRDCGR
jgi:hypothetical protein